MDNRIANQSLNLNDNGEITAEYETNDLDHIGSHHVALSGGGLSEPTNTKKFKFGEKDSIISDMKNTGTSWF